MGTLSIATMALGLAATAAVGIPGAHSDPDGPETIATASDGNERMTVPVRIGEHGPYPFLLDTGAQTTVVSSRLASELGLVPHAGNRNIVGIAGERRVDMVDLDEIQLGRRSVSGLVAPLLNGADMDADGIIGVDGMQGQRVLFDFRHHSIAVSDARSLGGNEGYDIIVTARRRKGQLILTKARINGIETDVVIDTGSQPSIGNRALQQAMWRNGATSQTIILHSVTGQEIPAQVNTAAVLRVGALQLSNVTIAFADSPAFAAMKLDRHPALLLGMHELKSFGRVAIDFAQHKVLFDLKDEEAAE